MYLIRRPGFRRIACIQPDYNCTQVGFALASGGTAGVAGQGKAHEHVDGVKPPLALDMAACTHTRQCAFVVALPPLEGLFVCHSRWPCVMRICDLTLLCSSQVATTRAAERSDKAAEVRQSRW